MAIGPQHDIFRLDVAVNDPALVSRRQGPRHLRGDRNGLADRDRAAIQTRAQRFAFDELGDDERPAAVVAEIVDDENVRVVE